MATSDEFPVIDGLTQVTALGTVLVALFVSGRLVSNIQLHRRLYADDYAAILGTVLFIVYAGLCTGIDQYVRHVQPPSARNPTAPFILKAVYATEVLVSPAALAAKASVLFLYLRIFNPSVMLRRSIVVVASITCLLALPSLPLFSFYCAPNATLTIWAAPVAVTCAATSTWAALQQLSDAVLNLVILVLPLPSIFQLHLSLKRRLMLAFVLMHGVFALAASITAAVYRVHQARTPATATASVLWFRTAAFAALAVQLSMTLVSGSFHACWGLARAAHAHQLSRRTGSDTACGSDDKRSRIDKRAASGEVAASASAGSRTRSASAGAQSDAGLGPLPMHGCSVASADAMECGHASGMPVGLQQPWVSPPPLVPPPPLPKAQVHTPPSPAVSPISGTPPSSPSSRASDISVPCNVDPLPLLRTLPCISPDGMVSEEAQSTLPVALGTCAHECSLPRCPHTALQKPCSLPSESILVPGCRAGLMAEIEAAVGTAGRVRLVVRPTGGAEPQREYMVESVDGDYVVERAVAW